MTKLRTFSLNLLLLALVPSLAGAEPSAKESAKNRVNSGLLKALSQQDAERSRFSRVIQPPRERRLRLLSNAALYDEKGRAFFPYATDVRYGEEWHEGISGCVYYKSGQIFVRLDDEYRPVAFLLGEDVAPVKGVCTERKAPPPRA